MLLWGQPPPAVHAEQARLGFVVGLTEDNFIAWESLYYNARKKGCRGSNRGRYP